HGGRIEARSQGRGQGSEFLVHLPASSQVRAREPAASVEEASGELPRRRILIVDDNVDAAQALDGLLAAMGQETAVVHDGVAALETAARFHPDLVLLDIGMPQLDGYEVAHRLRAMPGGEH